MRGTIREVVKGEKYELLWDGPRKADGGRNKKHRRFNGTARQAEAELARLVVEAGGEKTPAETRSNKLTVGQWVDQWLAETEGMQRVGVQALRSYHTHLGAVKRGIGAITLQELSPKDIRAYYMQALAGGRQIGQERRGAGLSKRTVHHQHTALKAALQVAVDEGLLLRNPAKDKRAAPPPPDDHAMPVLQVDQVKRLLYAVEGGPLQVPVVLALGAGLRMGEVLGLKWSAVRMGPNLLWVNESLIRITGGLAAGDPKRGSKRCLPMPAFLIEVLERHRAEQAELKAAVGEAWKENGLVVCMEDGRPMRHEYLSRGFGKLMDTMGWPEVTYHSLRRTHGSLLALQQVNPKVVQERLGHRNYETTHKHYTAVLQGMHQQAADSLDSLLQSAD